MKELFENLLKLQDLEFGDGVGSDVEAAMSALRQKIPVPILGHYDRLTAQGKKGVALVRNRVCTGCHMSVPTGAFHTLMHADDIQVCGNCGRYLCLAPDEGRESEVLPPAKAIEKRGKPSPKLTSQAV